MIRFHPKDFRQRQPDPSSLSGWKWSINGIRRVLYHLPEICQRKNEPVFIVEGEKDADRLLSMGLLSTTNAQGAGKWEDSFSESLRGRDVVILPDNDEPGKKHAEKIALSIYGIARKIKIIDLPGLEKKGDVSDFLDKNSVSDLLDIIKHSPEWSTDKILKNAINVILKDFEELSMEIYAVLIKSIGRA